MQPSSVGLLFAVSNAVNFRGGSPCIVDPFPEKPKGMHWRTYQRLQLEAEGAEMLFLSYL